MAEKEENIRQKTINCVSVDSQTQSRINKSSDKGNTDHGIGLKLETMVCDR